jgi:hypothetical protein
MIGNFRLLSEVQWLQRIHIRLIGEYEYVKAWSLYGDAVKQNTPLCYEVNCV